MKKAFIGIDIGTQGVRGVVVTEAGEVLDSCRESFADINLAQRPGRQEQNPADWWRAAQAVLRKLSETPAEIAAIALDGTSGTILPLDAHNMPLTNAIMYNDTRARRQAERLTDAARSHEQRHGYHFNAAYALPKILWCQENGIPASRYVHQTDYIVGKLTGIYDRTDMSNALKTGFDLIDERWPDFVTERVPLATLPAVLPCGRLLGSVSAEGAAATGLAKGTPVCAGATDGYASSLAACASQPGDWASIIGTTLTIKGVTKELIKDPSGVVYSHKHPQGWWMPGGASNVGGRCLNVWFGGENFERLNRAGARLEPTGALVYPLLTPGERFPFVQGDFCGFSSLPAEQTDEEKRYLATLEGVGYVERMCYAHLASLGAAVSDEIYTTGGGCRSELWLETRASILNRTLKVPASTDAAMGSAMLAASSLHFKDLSEAVKHMGRIRATISPDARKAAIYDELYESFVYETKRQRGARP